MPKWKLEHPFELPTYLQSLEILQRAWMIAADLFSALLNEQYAGDEDDDFDAEGEWEDLEWEGRQTRPLPAMERWKTDPELTATQAIVELTEELWSDRTPRFQVWAEDLLQGRMLDRLPLPTDRDDPLAIELAKLVDEVLVEVGD